MPNWLELARRAAQALRRAREAPRLKIINCFCGLRMARVGTDGQGHDVYECAESHVYIPGVDVGDKDGLIEKTRGRQPGEI